MVRFLAQPLPGIHPEMHWSPSPMLPRPHPVSPSSLLRQAAISPCEPAPVHRPPLVIQAKMHHDGKHKPQPGTRQARPSNPQPNPSPPPAPPQPSSPIMSASQSAYQTDHQNRPPASERGTRQALAPTHQRSLGIDHPLPVSPQNPLRISVHAAGAPQRYAPIGCPDGRLQPILPAHAS